MLVRGATLPDANVVKSGAVSFVATAMMIMN
jgi:hypothetical protein